MSDSLQPHGLQHARLPCPSPTPGACSNSCPSQWCHPTISSSVIPFSSCPQFFPASGSFPVSQFFPSGGQNIGISASASVLPMNIQDWFPLGWTDCFEPSIGWLQTNSFVVNFSLNPLDRRMPCLELPEGSPWSSDVFFSLHTLFCLISTSAELPYKEMGTASWSTLGNAGSVSKVGARCRWI